MWTRPHCIWREASPVSVRSSTWRHGMHGVCTVCINISVMLMIKIIKNNAVSKVLNFFSLPSFVLHPCGSSVLKVTALGGDAGFGWLRSSLRLSHLFSLVALVSNSSAWPLQFFHSLAHIHQVGVPLLNALSYVGRQALTQDLAGIDVEDHGDFHPLLATILQPGVPAGLLKELLWAVDKHVVHAKHSSNLLVFARSAMRWPPPFYSPPMFGYFGAVKQHTKSHSNARE